VGRAVDRGTTEKRFLGGICPITGIGQLLGSRLDSFRHQLRLTIRTAVRRICSSGSYSGWKWRMQLSDIGGVIDSAGALKHQRGQLPYVYVDEISLKQADT
jgi:hypothetical protein